jgi:hypothetical protein
MYGQKYIDGIGEVNFESYFMNVIAPSMDMHHTCIINNEEKGVSGLIKYYKQRIVSNEKKL